MITGMSLKNLNFNKLIYIKSFYIKSKCRLLLIK
jgi:hypothetical protein